MAKSKRVFQIARDLGVESKAILDKCRAEGLELNNHMAAISLGLEATIREWFTAGTGGTAVETTQKVDLDKVKAKRRSAAKPLPVADDQDQDVDDDTEVAAEAEASAVDTGKASKAKPRVKSEPVPESVESVVEEEIGVSADSTQADTAVEAAESAQSDEAVSDADATSSVDESADDEDDSAMTEPPRPVHHTPTAAKLKGPKVVRIEAPEEIRAPRPRRSSEPRGGGGGGGPMGPMPGDVMRSTGPARGRGAGGKQGAGSDDDGGRSPRRKSGGETASPRRGGKAGEADAWFKGARRAQDLIEREERLNQAAGFMRQRRLAMKKRAAATGGKASASPAESGGKVTIAQPFTIKDLSATTGIKTADFIKFLFKKGVMATINAAIDTETAMEVCLEYGIDLDVKEAQTAEEVMVDKTNLIERNDIRRRLPVVAVLGHVDHGKTSLLDKIRSTDRVSGEDGGITQHIGAFRASIKGGEGEEKTVVFLDTPGHQAFSNMRARGANLADIVVLVVAADDGVMPQTIESINHASAAGIPIVVALNKIDRPDATEGNIQKIYGQLAEHGLNPSEWGGTTEVMKVSAMTGDGIADLIEVLDYQADLLELKAGYDGRGQGQVIEAELDPGRGSVARVLVREGELKVGDFVVVGRAFGKVRSMVDDRGNQLPVAGPSTPIELSGIDSVPDAGDKLYVTTSLREAETIAEQRRDAERKRELAEKSKISLDNVFDQIQAAGVKELRIVIKADVQGSLEVLRSTLESLSTEEVAVKVLHSAVGGITESDVVLADASDAIIVGFHVIASQKARGEAERRGVDVRLYRVIYDLTDDVTKALEGMLTPERRETVLGHAEVRQVFKVSKVGAVAGCYVTDGTIQRAAYIRVTRDGIVIEHDRVLEQLKRFKDDAREVRSGMECGMKIVGYDDIREGDVLECYTTTEEKRTLS